MYTLPHPEFLVAFKLTFFWTSKSNQRPQTPKIGEKMGHKTNWIRFGHFIMFSGCSKLKKAKNGLFWRSKFGHHILKVYLCHKIMFFILYVPYTIGKLSKETTFHDKIAKSSFFIEKLWKCTNKGHQKKANTDFCIHFVFEFSYLYKSGHTKYIFK